MPPTHAPISKTDARREIDAAKRIGPHAAMHLADGVLQAMHQDLTHTPLETGGDSDAEHCQNAGRRIAQRIIDRTPDGNAEIVSVRLLVVIAANELRNAAQSDAVARPDHYQDAVRRFDDYVKLALDQT